MDLLENGRMVDAVFSAGVIAYVGEPGRLREKSPEHYVVAEVGEPAFDLLPRIKGLLQAMHAAEPPLWNHASLVEMGLLVEGWLRANHPELTPEAVAALRNRFTYDYK
ncbi:hypothetical protein LWC34_16755 [Kibdelosporangium philippinense]|uniref:Uncharacterized protein n=1 Tax=Kibdelosporangium philippinense TaxID=211113 RepID=A0ABS8ZAD0_9PSEU|nr:hypothetical protein [Kibdelosporangium philippinense]MCE7004472.1 hypothetical protein [Kibdelosporangium philippinense]